MTGQTTGVSALTDQGTVVFTQLFGLVPTTETASLNWIPVYFYKGGFKPCMTFDQNSMSVAQTPRLCYRSAGFDYKRNTNWL